MPRLVPALPSGRCAARLRPRAYGLAMAIATALSCGQSLHAQNAAVQAAYDLPAQTTASALTEAARQGGFTIDAEPGLLSGSRTSALSGRYTPTQALDRLLSGTGLRARETAPGRYVIERAGPAPATTPAKAGGGDTLETIVVTGNRRQEELRYFAGSVSPVTAADLERVGAESMSQYLTRVPGVAFTETTPGLANVTIRGVGTTIFQDQGQQTTGLFFNDIPLTEPNFNFATPDVDTFDVDRIEILRGPQGTTYGSGTLGGAVNYIANGPRLGQAEARILAGFSHTDGADGLNHEIKAMGNAPLGEDMALRAVLVKRDRAGYMTNLGIGPRESMDSKLLGGRLMFDWRISDSATLSWISMFQELRNHDRYTDRDDLGRYRRSTVVREPFNTRVAIHNLKYSHYFDPATLNVSITRKRKSQYSEFDVTRDPFFSGTLLGGRLSPVIFAQRASLPGTTFEARLTSNTSAESRFEWSGGVFYDRTKEDINNVVFANGAARVIEDLWAGQFGPGVGARGAPNDRFFNIEAYPTGTEKAVFGEVSWRFAPAWKFTVGGRYFNTQVDTTLTNYGFLYEFITAPPRSTLIASQKEKGFSPKLVLSYQVNDQNMVYALASRGFRYGGPNPNPPSATLATPKTFGSDALVNFELGYRTGNASGTWVADITAFQINWSDIQLRLQTPEGLAYADNVGKARIRGIEASTTWRPSRNFDWQASLTLTDGILRTDFSQGPNAPIVRAGTRLPGSSRVRFNTAATFTWDGDYAPFLTAAYYFVGGAPSQLTDQKKYTHGGYGVLDLRGGFKVGNGTYTAYFNNVGNVYGITSSSDAFVNPPATSRTVVPPRTVGVTADFTF